MIGVYLISILGISNIVLLSPDTMSPSSTSTTSLRAIVPNGQYPTYHNGAARPGARGYAVNQVPQQRPTVTRTQTTRTYSTITSRRSLTRPEPYFRVRPATRTPRR